MKAKLNRYFCVIMMLLAMKAEKRPPGSLDLLEEASTDSYDLFWRLTHPNYTPTSAAERWVKSRL